MPGGVKDYECLQYAGGTTTYNSFKWSKEAKLQWRKKYMKPHKEIE